jgi:hypothetical protein
MVHGANQEAQTRHRLRTESFLLHEDVDETDAVDLDVDYSTTPASTCPPPREAFTGCISGAVVLALSEWQARPPLIGVGAHGCPFLQASTRTSPVAAPARRPPEPMHWSHPSTTDKDAHFSVIGNLKVSGQGRQ